MSGRRTLHIAERTVAADARSAYLAELAARRRTCEAAGAHFWAFEHATIPGRFVEFTEARDAATLQRVAVTADGHLWHAVEEH